MNILIRADSSSKVGTGHIMRDLVLASQYPDDNVVFATQNLKGNINFKIVGSGYKIQDLKSNSVDELDFLIKNLNIDLLIVDSYLIDYEFEKELKSKNKNLKLFVFDDTYEKHFCDILLNHNISADKNKYKDLVPNNCELRCGSKYTLLRDEFIKERQRLRYTKKINNTKTKTKTIFVAMGGADHSGITIKVLKVLSLVKNIKVVVATTFANPNLDKLQKYCKYKSWVNLYINSSQIAKLIGKSDLAVITPSVIANEVCYLGKKIIAIKTVDNQTHMAEYLSRIKVTTLTKFNATTLRLFIGGLE
jgi:UDP-2,4-diacetamido-2,4,6-trideoxy-beta-L-altropyranose hydrolase